MTKALVTGGYGFIGLKLSEHLAKKGVNVTLCDNLSRGKNDEAAKSILEMQNTFFVKADLTDPNEYSKLDKYDYVYHLAAINGTELFYEMPQQILRTNIMSCMNILEWFKDTKKGKILFSSSSETYAGTISKFNAEIPTKEDVPLCVEDPYNARWSYGGSKIAGELLFINYSRKFEFPMSIIRYHNIYGPRMGFEHVIPQFIERIYKKEDPFKIFGSDNSRAFCHVSDAVEATCKVMESEKTNFNTINIGNSKEEISIIELAKKLFSIANYSSKIENAVSPDGSVSRRCPNTNKLKELTGFESKVNLNEGLNDIFEWYWNYFEEGN